MMFKRITTAAVLFAISAGLLVAAGCGSTTSRPEAARKAVVQWTTALTKRNFYDACGYEVYDGKFNATDATISKNTKGVFTARRYCATSWAGGGFTSDIQSISRTPVYYGVTNENTNLEFYAVELYSSGLITKAQEDKYFKQAQAHRIKLKVPKNGYVFAIKSDGYRVYVGVQRDANGQWRIVSVTS